MPEQQQTAPQPPAADAPYWEHHDWWRTHLDAARTGGEDWWRPYGAGRFDSLSLADAVLASARTGLGLVPDEHDAWHRQIVDRALVIGANMRWHGPDGPLTVLRWAQGLAGYIQLAAHVTARSITDQLDGPARIAAEDLLAVLWPAPNRARSTREAGQPGRALFRAIQNYTDPDTRLPGLLELPRLGMNAGSGGPYRVAVHHLLRATITANALDKQHLAHALRRLLRPDLDHDR